MVWAITIIPEARVTIMAQNPIIDERLASG
jgi:hypothetical protein